VKASTDRSGLDKALDDLLSRAGPGQATLSLAASVQLAQQHGATRRAVEIAALRREITPDRYQRSMGTVGFDGQIALLEASVAVVGCGGLGGWATEALARLGVGSITLIDGDRFQDSNLNRQLGCTESVLGLSKPEVLANRVAQVNGSVSVSPVSEYITADNAADLLANAQVVVDALDSLPKRMMLQEACSLLGVPLVHGAIGGLTGQVMTIMPGDAGLKALYGEHLPEHGIETQLGTPTATPMMVAAWQAQETLKLIVGCGEPLRHRMLLLDAEWGTATFVELA